MKNTDRQEFGKYAGLVDLCRIFNFRYHAVFSMAHSCLYYGYK